MLKALQVGLTGLFLMLDGLVYWLVGLLFSLYDSLAGAEIIKETFFADLMDRIYVIIGVFMLFVVAYSLLKALINPDNLVKDTGKIITNIIISIILIGIVPLIFQYARDLQSIILEENIIGNLFFEGNTNSIEKTGTNIAFQVLSGFINFEDDSIIGDEEFKNAAGTNIATWADLKQGIESGAYSNFLEISRWAEPIYEGEGGAQYKPIISTICGAFLAYVILSFCIDLGVRVVKFAFYQIIAPIPILLRIIPEKKSVFDNWVKASIATYMEVFIRIFIIVLIGAICVGIFQDDYLQLNGTNNDLGIFGTIIVILGIFSFAKQAPKLISDVLGIDSGNIKLGIGGKLAAGGAFGIAAMLGGGLKTGAQYVTKGFENTGKRWKNVSTEKGFGRKFLAAEKAFASTLWHGSGAGVIAGGLAGFASGAARSAKGGFSAKNYKDAAKAAGEGATNALIARDKKDAYRASNGAFLSVIAHQEDALRRVGKFLGINASEEGVKKTLDVFQRGFDFKKQLEDLAIKKSTQAKVYDQQIEALNQAPIKREDYDNDVEYSNALIQRARQIDQLKDAKTFEVMKEINSRLENIEDPKNAEFAEIVTSFQTFKRQNANLLSGIKDLTNEGWRPEWNSVNPLTISKEELHNLVSDMKRDFTYMANHTEFERNKNEAARAYAEFMQKENDKK